MIADTTVLSEIRESWKGVEMLRQKIKAAILGAFSEGSSFVLFAADAAHNLPFVQACAVLNDALEQLRDEGHFRCKGRLLGTLLYASKDKLRWKGFSTIEEAVNRRNAIAHHAQIVPRGECWRLTDAIRQELVSFNVLEATSIPGTEINGG
jgi:hypothetical protein